MAPAAAGTGGFSARLGAQGGARMGGLSSRPVEEQRVWIYCRSHQEHESIFAFCRSAEHVRRIPEDVPKAPEQAGVWRAAMKLRLHEPPPPYGMGAWKEFLSDVDALLGASFASISSRCCQEPCAAGAAGIDAMRWPSLLVTDRRKLCEAVCDDAVRMVLAEAARLPLDDVLHVVLAADFKTLCGYITEEAPLEICGSVALADLKPPTEHRADSEEAMVLTTGVYMHSSAEVLARGGPIMEQVPPVVGARCLALLGPGRCAYAAVSADGLRRMDAHGPWEVVNGHLLVGGVAGRHSFSYMELSAPAPKPLPGGTDLRSPMAAVPPSPSSPSGAAQQRPVIIALDELRDLFDRPVSLSECLAAMPEAQAPSSTRAATRQSAGEAASRAISKPNAAMQQPALEARSSSSASSAACADGFGMTCPRLEPRSDAAGEAPMSARTRPAKASTLTLQPMPPATPRTPSAPSRPSPSMRGSATQAWDLAAGDQAASWTFTTCPLRPGTYKYEVGEKGNRDYRSFSLTLNADGSFSYRDCHFRTLLSAASDGTSWEVHKGILALAHKKRASGRPGFLLSTLRGKREVERRIARVEISVALLQAKCDVRPLSQDASPFAGHEPLPVSQRLGGWLDPGGLPAMADPPFDPDLVPVKDFEEQLRRLGVCLEKEGLTDIGFIDRNADRFITLQEMVESGKLGAPVAPDEVVHELADALVGTFGTLPSAFEFLQQCAAGDTVTLEEFKEGLQQALSDKRVKAKAGKLKTWLKDREDEEIAAVFSSINPFKHPGIGLEELVGMNLYTALLALRHLEEFQDFVFQKFGRDNEGLLAAFEAMDAKHKQELTDKTFMEGVKKIGCKHVDANIFGLLDFSFSGKVTPTEFCRLGSFSAKRLLDTLQALKDGALLRFGSLGSCFDRLVEVQSKVSGQAGDGTVSLDVLMKEQQKGTLGDSISSDDLPLVLLFLGQAGGRHHSDGHLALDEWRLLQVFDSTFLSGCPMRLRECLESRFGSMESAFLQVQGSWLPRLIGERLRRAAMEGLVAAVSSSSAPQPRLPRSTGSKASTAAPVATPAASPVAALESARASTAPHSSRSLGEANQRPHTHCGVRGPPSRGGQGMRDNLGTQRGPALFAASWAQPIGPCKQIKGMTEARMPTPVRAEQWTMQPRTYQAAWPVNEDTFSPCPTPRNHLLPGLAGRPTLWERPGAISAVNWGAF